MVQGVYPSSLVFQMKSGFLSVAVFARDTPIRELIDGRGCNLMAAMLVKPPELSLTKMSSARPQEQKSALQSDSRSQLQGAFVC